MGRWTRQREYRYSADGIECCMQHIEFRVRPHDPALGCCGLLAIYIANKWLSGYKIACLGSLGGEEECYYKYQKQEFITRLRSCYPDIPSVCADKAVETFMTIILIANATHCCPKCEPPSGVNGYHEVQIEIQPRSSSHPAEAEAEEEVIVRQLLRGEQDWPGPKPATQVSVAGLLKADTVVVKAEEGCCGICMEDMVMKTVRMPCSHPFHRSCLVEWLINNHSCPICRYQLPAAKFQLS